MKVRKFTAENMPEAMKQVRKELGDEAVILNSKAVNTGGFLGLFTKKNIQVIAAIDEEQRPTKPVKKRQDLEETSRKTLKNEEYTSSKEELHHEMEELKQLISSMRYSTGSYPTEIENINHLLLEQEVEASVRTDIINNLLSEWYRSDHPTEAIMKKQAKKHIAELLYDVNFGPCFPTKKFINLVGPTGVGKTTTLAKIAAYYQLDKKMSVGFITTDTYRIAAVEQLKTYAKILQIPLEIVYSIEDFNKAKDKFQHMDVVLIDSAGRNFQNAHYLKELKNVIEFDDEMETYLVLSLTSKYKDMKNIYEQFSPLPVNKFIFTKKDETAAYGSIINMTVQTGVGAAYITNGQNVPDDIEAADAEDIVNWIFEGAAYE